MKLTKNKETKENREFWELVEKTTFEVRESFPKWKMSETTIERFKIQTRRDEDPVNGHSEIIG